MRFPLAARIFVLAAAGIAGVVATSTWFFNRRVDREAYDLLSQCSPRTPVRASELALLPPVVRRWLEVSGVVGRPRATIARLQQKGELRTSPDGAWMPASAQQHVAVTNPGFVWKVDVRMMGVMPIVGRDKYVNGEGFMLIKAGGLVNVVNASGTSIDQGAMLRYLGEIVWFPSAALAPYITWEQLDESRARSTMRDRGQSVTGVFTFNAAGHVESFAADRFFKDRLEKWVVPISEWKDVRGVIIPVRGDVVWKLAGGDFNYYRWQILDVEPNPTEIY